MQNSRHAIVNKSHLARKNGVVVQFGEVESLYEGTCVLPAALQEHRGRVEFPQTVTADSTNTVNGHLRTQKQLNPLTPRRTLVAPFTKISILL